MRLRNGVLYVEKMYLGHRITESLRTRNVELAKKRRDEKLRLFKAAVEQDKWDGLQKTRSKKSFAKLGQVLELHAQFSEWQEHAKATPAKYKNCLRRVVAATLGPAAWRERSTSELGPDLADRYVEHWLKVRKDEIWQDKEARQETINMAISALRNASALFSRRARSFYRQEGLKLPESLSEFGIPTRYKARPISYKLPNADLIARTLKAGAELEGTQWLIFVMAFELACRGADMSHARREWFVEDAEGQIYLEVPGEKTKGKRMHRKPLSRELLDAILTEVGERDYLLPGDSFNMRRNLVQRGLFPQWMRGLGWETNELAHELRKLRACYIYHHGGADGHIQARRLLGHANLSTTEQYYADNLGLPVQLIPYFTRWASPSAVPPADRLKTAQFSVVPFVS